MTDIAGVAAIFACRIAIRLELGAAVDAGELVERFTHACLRMRTPKQPAVVSAAKPWLLPIAAFR